MKANKKYYFNSIYRYLGVSSKRASFALIFFIFKLNKNLLLKEYLLEEEWVFIKNSWEDYKLQNINAVDILSKEYEEYCDCFKFPFNKKEYVRFLESSSIKLTDDLISRITLLKRGRWLNYSKRVGVDMKKVLRDPSSCGFEEFFNYFQNKNLSEIVVATRINSIKAKNSKAGIVIKYKNKLESIIGEEVISSVELLDMMPTSNSASLTDFCYSKNLDEYVVTAHRVVLKNKRPLPKNSFIILWEDFKSTKNNNMGGRKFYKKSQLDVFIQHKKDLERSWNRSAAIKTARENQYLNLKRSIEDRIKEEVISIRDFYSILEENDINIYKKGSISAIFKKLDNIRLFYERKNTLIFLPKSEVPLIIEQLKNYRECNRSHGEIYFEEFLKNNRIKFIKNYKVDIYDGILDKIRNLRYDFFLEDYNLFVEIDGGQHYEFSTKFGNIENFEDLKRRDSMKNEYCNNNNINIIRIPWMCKDVKDSNSLISTFLEELKNKNIIVKEII